MFGPGALRIGGRRGERLGRRVRAALTSMLFPGPLPGFISINECFHNDGKHPFFSSQKM